MEENHSQRQRSPRAAFAPHFFNDEGQAGQAKDLVEQTSAPPSTSMCEKEPWANGVLEAAIKDIKLTAMAIRFEALDQEPVIGDARLECHRIHCAHATSQMPSLLSKQRSVRPAIIVVDNVVSRSASFLATQSGSGAITVSCLHPEGLSQVDCLDLLDLPRPLPLPLAIADDLEELLQFLRGQVAVHVLQESGWFRRLSCRNDNFPGPNWCRAARR